MPGDLNELEWIYRLSVAAALSGLIGFEREASQKAAGLRTHMLVGLGAALFTMVGATALGGDPSRVAAQVVSGIGFLGAGVIFRQGVNVRGLTTAASLWAVAAIGMTAGAGLQLGAVIVTAIALVILYGLKVLESTLRSRYEAEHRRPVGITLSNLHELNEIVALACSLDPTARQADVIKLDERRFVVKISIANDRVDTVTAGVAAFMTVEEALELDPD